MISNFKKLALGVMSVGGLIVPLAVVASCSSTTKEVDYKIGAIANPRLVWGNIASQNFKTLTTLSKAFIGLNSDNLENLEASIVSVDSSNSYQITLMAKDGYTINNVKEFKSKVFSVDDDMAISIKTQAPTDIKPVDIEGENYKNFSVLSKLFDGADFNDDNLANLVIEKINGSQEDSYKIEISPIEGVTINGSTESLTSLEFKLVVNVMISKINPIVKEISTFDTTEWTIKSLETLSKVFVIDVDQEVVDNGLIVTFDNNLHNAWITVKAKPGYMLNNGDMDTIVSETFEELQGMPGESRPAPSADLSPQDIDETNLHTFATLEKLFTNLTIPQVENDITASLNELADDFYSITLRAKGKKMFKDGRAITSVTFSLK
ncbi:MAG: hypothetical protein ACRCWU_00010 [Metamycoplasmataceae bacterium]